MVELAPASVKEVSEVAVNAMVVAEVERMRTEAQELLPPAAKAKLPKAVERVEAVMETAQAEAEAEAAARSAAAAQADAQSAKVSELGFGGNSNASA